MFGAFGAFGAEHQAAATASGSAGAPARRWDRIEITRIGGLAGPSGPFRVPCSALHISGVSDIVAILASDPVRSSAHVPELPFRGAGSKEGLRRALLEVRR